MPIFQLPELTSSVRLLAVDDSPTLQKMIRKNLGDYELRIVGSAQECLNAIPSFKPMILLLDYHLGDMSADMICANLKRRGFLQNLVVILMSAEAESIHLLQKSYPQIKQVIAKPFTPDTLRMIVRTVISNHVAPQTARAPEQNESRLIAFGNTHMSPLLNILEEISQASLTAHLQFYLQEPTYLDLYCVEGKPVIVTSTNADWYCAGLENLLVRDLKVPENLMVLAKNIQKETGQPLFLVLESLGGMPKDDAVAMTYARGNFCFAPLWTIPRTWFCLRSVPLKELPDYVQSTPPHCPSILQWALNNLREIDSETVSTTQAWGDNTGIPMMTRKGPDVLKMLEKTEEEACVLNAIVDSHKPITELSKDLIISVEAIQSIIFRFIELGIIEYIPAYKLKPNVF